MKLILKIVLWIAIIFLGWKLYNSITGHVKFNKLKEDKYVQVIAKLKDIKAAQLAHQDVTGQFAGTFDSLVRFVDTAQFAITQRRDSSYADVEKNKAYGLSEGYFIDVIITDTLGFKSVKDSLFPASDHYKNMMKVPGAEANFELQAGKLDKNGTLYSVFEAKVDKAVVLAGQDKVMIAQEKQAISVESVKGPYIKVGSMEDVDTGGNWPKLYDSAKDNK